MSGAPTPQLRVLSLGAGVQSTALYVMAATGALPERPDFAIFADTQWEPETVYQHLDRLDAAFGSTIPIHRVTAGNIREDQQHGRGKTARFASMPLFAKRLDGSDSIVRRQCTKEFKIEPIGREVRRVLAERGLPKKAGIVEQWIGISLDEAHRMKPARVRYIRHRWPLIELRLRRSELIRWLEAQGWGASKSACIGCPFRDDASWVEMRRERPEDFADAVAFDREIRQLPRMDCETFLHRSLVPLDEVEFRHADQLSLDGLDGFAGECEGMCGV